MTRVYRNLSYLVAAVVAGQLAALAYAVAGLRQWVADGGELYESIMDNAAQWLPEGAGFTIHGVSERIVLPAIAVLLLATSFRTITPAATRWAVGICLLVSAQVGLGLLSQSVPAAGGLYGAGALLLAGMAVHTGRRSIGWTVTSPGAAPAGSGR